MKIYFVNSQSTAASPADLILADGMKIECGDFCVRLVNTVLQVLPISNPHLRWHQMSQISSCTSIKEIHWGNFLLYSFNGVDLRCGNIERLELLTQCFPNPIVKDFLLEAIAILNYEKDLFDLALLKRIMESGKVVHHHKSVKTLSTIPTAVNKQRRPFVSYLAEEIQAEIVKMLKEKSSKDVMCRIRKAYPKEFRTAFKEFNENNPNGNLYEGLP